MGEPARDQLLCRCFRVLESTVRTAIRENGLATVEQVAAATSASTGCSSCYDDIQAMLDSAQGTKRVAAPASLTLTNAQKRLLIQKAFEERVRPLYLLNGVAMQLLDVQGERAFTRFLGGAAGSQRSSILTLKWYLVKIMSEVCGARMQQIEMNVLEGQDIATLP